MYTLRSNSTVNLAVPSVGNTFQDTAARNKLPTDIKSFSKETCAFFKNRTM